MRGTTLRHGAVWAAVALGAAATAGAALAADALPVGPGSKLVYAKCQACHSLQYVEEAKGLLPAQWDALIANMQDYGLSVSPDEKKTILTYLKTYMGPNPPPAAAATTADAGAPAKVDGAAVFQQNCAACHGAAGAGQPGSYPPLAGNGDLKKSAELPALVVLGGMTGPITVSGKPFDATMPTFGHLSDTEIAAVVNYVRSAWGNDAGGAKMTVATVGKLRAEGLSATQVHARRAELLK